MSGRTELGDDIRLFPSQSLEPEPGAGRAAVSVDAEDIDRGVVLHDLAHLALVRPGDDCHNRMVRVLLFDDLGQLLDFFPHAHRLREARENFHFVAEPPDEQIRMVLVAAHGLADLLALLLHHLRVKVRKSVALVHEPDSRGEGQTEFLDLLKIRLSGGVGFLQLLDAPEAHRVGAQFFGQGEGTGSAHAENAVGFAVAQQFPAVRGLTQLNFGSGGHGVKGESRADEDGGDGPLDVT